LTNDRECVFIRETLHRKGDGFRTVLVAERLELRQRSVVGRLVLHVEVEQEGGGRVAVIVLGRDVQRVVARDVGEVLVGDVDGALRRSRRQH
jgi:hypothetical protein